MQGFGATLEHEASQVSDWLAKNEANLEYAQARADHIKAMQAYTMAEQSHEGDPDRDLTRFDAQQSQWDNDILSRLHNPDAKRDVTNYLKEQNAQFRTHAGTAAMGYVRQNLVNGWRATREERQHIEPNLSTQEQFDAKVRSVIDHVHLGMQSGVPEVRTPEMAEAELNKDLYNLQYEWTNRQAVQISASEDWDAARAMVEKSSLSPEDKNYITKYVDQQEYRAAAKQGANVIQAYEDGVKALDEGTLTPDTVRQNRSQLGAHNANLLMAYLDGLDKAPQGSNSQAVVNLQEEIAKHYTGNADIASVRDKILKARFLNLHLSGSDYDSLRKMAVQPSTPYLGKALETAFKENHGANEANYSWEDIALANTMVASWLQDQIKEGKPPNEIEIMKTAENYRTLAKTSNEEKRQAEERQRFFQSPAGQLFRQASRDFLDTAPVELKPDAPEDVVANVKRARELGVTEQQIRHADGMKEWVK
jgi:hypothetical protein